MVPESVWMATHPLLALSRGWLPPQDVGAQSRPTYLERTIPMGLDMYFFIESPIPANVVKNKAEMKKLLELPMAEISKNKIGQQILKYQIARLRKVNSIHGWIIREAANGVDDCNPVRLTREALTTLKLACEQALGRRAIEECFLPDEEAEDFTAPTLEEAVGIMLQQEEELAQRASKYAYDSNDPLRPTTGPFFGSYQKNAKYYSDLDTAIQMINYFLRLPEYCQYIYRASW